MGFAAAPPITALLLLFLCFASSPPVTSSLKTFHANYGPFDDPLHYNTILEVESPATISNGALQVTPDSASDDFNLYDQSGRIFLKQRFKLWEGGVDSVSVSDRVASFNSSFLINLYRPNNDPAGEGMAFVIAPDLELPANSHGQYLGLTNSTTDGYPSNRLVAVEFDTFKEDFDLDDNHLGLNINSVRSKTTTSLTPLGIQLAPEGPRFFNVWVQYDGVKKSIEVYIAEQAEKLDPTPPRPATPVLKSALELRGVVDQYSYFGFSASTGKTKQLNCVIRWNMTVEYYPENKGTKLKILLGVLIPVVVLVAAVIAAGLVCYRRRKKSERSNSGIHDALRMLPGTPREFRYKDLKKATNNFDEKKKLGQGGFGVVYKGMIQEENLEVAVKMFSRESLKGQGDFLAELTIINRLRHKHLVRLVGWCHKNGKLLLVYEYMPNGSLDHHLFGGPQCHLLTWDLRYKIISGVASALHYLHNEYDQRVVHRDLKASNILLDTDFNARLGDFGLARALDNEKTSYAEAEGILGTMGYIAPECFHTGKATSQSDIYAFGAVLLEVACGQRPGTKLGGYQLLVDYVWSLHRQGRLLEAVDERLGKDYVVEEAQRVLLLGLACSHPTASERPNTQAIVQILSGSIPAPSVPPFKPSFIWPSMPMSIEDITAETIDMPLSQFGTQHSDSFNSL